MSDTVIDRIVRAANAVWDDEESGITPCSGEWVQLDGTEGNLRCCLLATAYIGVVGDAAVEEIKAKRNDGEEIEDLLKKVFGLTGAEIESIVEGFDGLFLGRDNEEDLVALYKAAAQVREERIR